MTTIRFTGDNTTDNVERRAWCILLTSTHTLRAIRQFTSRVRAPRTIRTARVRWRGSSAGLEMKRQANSTTMGPIILIQTSDKNQKTPNLTMNEYQLTHNDPNDMITSLHNLNL